MDVMRVKAEMPVSASWDQVGVADEFLLTSRLDVGTRWVVETTNGDEKWVTMWLPGINTEISP